MNTFHSSQMRDPGADTISDEETLESIFPFRREENITDGGEFLDDAIRMKDQPFGDTDKKKDNSFQNA